MGHRGRGCCDRCRERSVVRICVEGRHGRKAEMAGAGVGCRKHSRRTRILGSGPLLCSCFFLGKQGDKRREPACVAPARRESFRVTYLRCSCVLLSVIMCPGMAVRVPSSLCARMRVARSGFQPPWCVFLFGENQCHSLPFTCRLLQTVVIFTLVARLIARWPCFGGCQTSHFLRKATSCVVFVLRVGCVG